MIQIDWCNVKAVIFDVDGTLYDQQKLRTVMLFEILKYYTLNPWYLKELKILRDFRREREKRTFDVIDDLENAQYSWGAYASGVSPEMVRSVVKKWIFSTPLRHISNCRYQGILEFFDNLHKRGITTAIFSDYPANEKVAALGLSPNCIVCSTDRNVDRLKPDPKGLVVITEKLGVSVEDCIFIGDRDERDGECARRAGMPYMILNKKIDGDNQFKTFYELNKHLDSSL